MPKKRKVLKSEHIPSVPSERITTRSIQKTAFNKQLAEESHLIAPEAELSGVNKTRVDEDCIDCGEVTEDNFLEQFNILKSLEKKEEDLKITLLRKKLKKRAPLLTDETELRNSLAEQQKVLDEKKKDLKMKDILCSNSQFSEILQEITRNTKSEENCTNEQKSCILNLVQQKKKLTKEVSQITQEITSLEGECSKLVAVLDNSACESASDLKKNDSTTDQVSSKINVEELKQLERKNKRRASRIQLLSTILLSLIENIQDVDNDDLIVLYDCCNQVVQQDFVDVDRVEGLCKSIYSTEI